MNTGQDKLIDYINHHHLQGRDQKEVFNELIKAGWRADQVEAAFASHKELVAPAPAHAPRTQGATQSARSKPIDFKAITGSSEFAIGQKLLNQKKKWMLWIVVPVFILAFLIPLLWFVLFGYVIFQLPKAFKQRKIRDESVSRFAQDNGFSFETFRTMKNTWRVKKDDHERHPNYPYEGYVEQISAEMKGLIGTLNFTYRSVEYEIPRPGQSKDYETTLNVLTVYLPASVPSLFVDSKLDNMIGNSLKRAIKIPDLEEHTMEGDFSKDFNVYAKKGEQIAVWEVLSPEVLEVLMAEKRFDIWMSDEVLNIINIGTEIEYHSAIPGMFHLAEILVEEIDRLRLSMRKDVSPHTHGQVPGATFGRTPN